MRNEDLDGLLLIHPDWFEYCKSMGGSRVWIIPPDEVLKEVYHNMLLTTKQFTEAGKQVLLLMYAGSTYLPNLEFDYGYWLVGHDPEHGSTIARCILSILETPAEKVHMLAGGFIANSCLRDAAFNLFAQVDSDGVFRTHAAISRWGVDPKLAYCRVEANLTDRVNGYSLPNS